MPSKKQSTPFIYKRFSAFLFSVVPLIGITVYLYGIRPLILLLIAVVIAVLSDLLVALMRKRSYNGQDMSSIMFTVIFVLLLPATVRYSIVLCGSILTVFIKHAFGDYTGCILHPSAFGFMASAICWPTEIFRYPQPFTNIGLKFDESIQLFESASQTIKAGGIPGNIDKVDFLLGNHPGPIGASYSLVILAILVFLIACKVTTWHTPFMYLLAIVVFAFCFPRLEISRLYSVLYEVLSDTLIFGAVYIAAEPVTSPVNPKAKLIYGVLLGLTAMLFGRYGIYQMGVVFAVVVINPISPYLDRKFPPKTGGTR
ncbi:MAG: RnfABCDGE type electron transport complex subunit D [Oscillospiraceae bacterium]|nr:RnfABCDGE type electron transport complex subunit D [Oscillospiraceae bacterium]